MEFGFCEGLKTGSSRRTRGSSALVEYGYTQAILCGLGTTIQKVKLRKLFDGDRWSEWPPLWN